jgi:hypothetical protein
MGSGISGPSGLRPRGGPLGAAKSVLRKPGKLLGAAGAAVAGTAGRAAGGVPSMAGGAAAAGDASTVAGTAAALAVRRNAVPYPASAPLPLTPQTGAQILNRVP